MRELAQNEVLRRYSAAPWEVVCLRLARPFFNDHLHHRVAVLYHGVEVRVTHLRTRDSALKCHQQLHDIVSDGQRDADRVQADFTRLDADG